MSKSSTSMIDTLQQEQKYKQQKFLMEMKEFPCLFNLGNCNLDVGNTKYSGSDLYKPNLSKNKWKFLRETLKDDDEDDEFAEAVWKENLLTRVYSEVNCLDEAIKLNQKILDQHGESNLVALANAAFLSFRRNDLDKTHKILRDLKKLKSANEFDNLKFRAICEQGYVFRKFGGAKNLLCAISLLNFSLPFCPHDERILFMLAMVYRRCTRFNIYSEDPENINIHDCALHAAEGLHTLGMTASNKTIRSAALIELSYLKFEDDIILERKLKGEHKLERSQWLNVVGQKDWKQLCEEAIEIGGDNLSEKVLKMAGQLFRYYNTDDGFKKSMELLTEAIQVKSTTRAYHHLAITYQKMAEQFELKNQADKKLERVTESDQQKAAGCQLMTLPSPPIDRNPAHLDAHLKFIAKVPTDKIKYFSKDNPFSSKAIDHFKKAAEISCYQNRPAVYDLAHMLFQTKQYGESRKTCLILITDGSNSNKILNDPVYIVNAHNLYGICCAEEAKEAHEDSEYLLAESEEKLILTVRLASHLAAKIPELASCATDLWPAFKTLKTGFMSGLQKESRDKLLSLCKFVHDYRYLHAVDEIILQDPALWENTEFIEQCLSTYLSLKALNSSLLFWDMVHIRLKSREKLSILKSEVLQDLRLQIAELKLDKTYVRTQRGIYFPDPVWKQILQERFEVTDNLKTYDIVIVEDVNDDYEPDFGTLSDNISRYLKEVLQKIFDLKTVIANEEGFAGMCYLSEQPEIISESWVAIFVLTKPCVDSQSLKSKFKALSIGGCGAQEKFVVEKVKNDSHLHEGDIAHMELLATEDKSEHLSSLFEWIINTSMSSFVNGQGASKIMLAVPDHLKHEDLPQAVRAANTFHLSDKDVEILALASQGDGSDQCINLVKKLFRAVLSKSQ